jgi:purine-nucleoside phosphorylase
MKADLPKLAAARISDLSPLRPRLAIVLGTGFNGALRKISAAVRVPYRQIPGFLPTGVAGHDGQLIIGKIAAAPVIVLSGRAHYYEGHSVSEVTFPVRALAAYGIRDLLLTNAAGGIHPKLRSGDFMIIRDHINFTGINPLMGSCPVGLPRFVDLTRAYDRRLSSSLRAAAKACRVPIHSGVYLAVSGPSYETAAEIRAFQRLGADAVGMSTVPEAIVARQCGLRVAGLSCITNRAAGLGSRSLSHDEVLATAATVRESAGKLLFKCCGLYRPEAQDSN